MCVRPLRRVDVEYHPPGCALIYAPRSTGGRVPQPKQVIGDGKTFSREFREQLVWHGTLSVVEQSSAENRLGLWNSPPARL